MEYQNQFDRVWRYVDCWRMAGAMHLERAAQGATSIYPVELPADGCGDSNNTFWGAVELRELNRSTTTFIAVTDKKRHHAHLNSISPIHQVDPGDAPTLLLHGDADKLVPLQQSQILIQKLNAVKIPTN
jgi:hypothetical protein